MGKDSGNAEAEKKKVSREEMTFDKIGDVMARFKNITSLFGDNRSRVEEKLDELQMAFGLASADSKNMGDKIEKRVGQKRA